MSSSSKCKDKRLASGPDVSNSANTAYGRPRPPLFRALGAEDPPAQIHVDGQSYWIIEELKHDSWAATARYRGPDGDIICKFNRQQPILGVSMKWLGRMLARREASFLGRFKDVPNIPAPCGKIGAGGGALDNAAARRYIPGAPLRNAQRVPDRFYPTLRETLRTMHESGVAYVDLHKRENIIVGDDGQPYLIDFQISFALPDGWIGRTWLVRWLFRLLAQSDEYHLRKHALAAKQHAMTRAELAAALNRPWWIRLHRCIGVPFREFRRWLLVLVRVRRGRGAAETEFAPEQSIRIDTGRFLPTAVLRRSA